MKVSNYFSFQTPNELKQSLKMIFLQNSRNLRIRVTLACEAVGTEEYGYHSE